MKLLPKFKWKNPVHLLALGFGLGAMPKAPGTFGTLIGVLFYWPMSYLSATQYLLLVLVMFLLGIYLCGKTAADFGVHDHGAIVWDEVVGYLITMSVVPLGFVALESQTLALGKFEGAFSSDWIWVVLGFLFFRLFDIWKPWPITLLDKNVHGGFGIMIDDVLAGIFAAALLALISFFLL